MAPYEGKPGLCVIINNMVFQEHAGLPDGKKDEESLQVLFTTLGFDVKIHQNLIAQEMIRKVESYSKMQHKGVFFLIILSHGTLVNNKDAVLGTDGEAVEIHYLESFFHATNCPSLHGVPKIFLIDACRGGKKEKGFTPKLTQSGGITTKSSATSLTSLTNTTSGTDSGHFVIVYASTYGNVAYYARNRGSHLTQTFVRVTTEASPDKTFTKIIQEVKARIQRSVHGHQTVESVDRLTRDYFIKRYFY